MTNPESGPGYWAPPAPGTPSMEPLRVPEPAVLRIAPVQGWQQADKPRRIFILAFPFLIVAWLLAARTDDAVAVTAPLLLLAPPIHFAVARLLRPYPPSGVGGSRKARHALAAFASAVALGIVLMAVSESSGTNESSFAIVFFTGIPALFVGVVTAIWGLIEASVRAGRSSS